MRIKARRSRFAFFGGEGTVFGVGKIADVREKAKASTRQLPFREVGNTIFLSLALRERILEVPCSHEEQSSCKTVQETPESIHKRGWVESRSLLKDGFSGGMTLECIRRSGQVSTQVDVGKSSTIEVVTAMVYCPSLSNAQEIFAFTNPKVQRAQLLPHSCSHTQQFQNHPFSAAFTHMTQKRLQIFTPYHIVKTSPCIRRHRGRRIPHELGERLLNTGGEASRAEGLQIRWGRRQGLSDGEFQEILKLEAEGRSVLAQEVLFEADFLLERDFGRHTGQCFCRQNQILCLRMTRRLVIGLSSGQADMFAGDPGDLFQIAKTGVVGGKQRHSSAQSPQYYNGHLNPLSLNNYITFELFWPHQPSSPSPPSSLPLLHQRFPYPLLPFVPQLVEPTQKLAAPQRIPSTTSTNPQSTRSKAEDGRQSTRQSNGFSSSDLGSKDDEMAK